jgi:hypothetical protein
VILALTIMAEIRSLELTLVLQKLCLCSGYT